MLEKQGFVVGFERRIPGNGTQLKIARDRSESFVSGLGFQGFASGKRGSVHPYVTSRLVVYLDGRIDNRREIADALTWNLRQTGPEGDAALLARAYEVWGTRLQSAVLGDYAFAIYDVAIDTLIGGTDSLGVRKLFRAEDGQFVWLSSSLRLALCSLQRIPDLDDRGLAEYLQRGEFSSETTVFRGVRPLGPAVSAVETRTRSHEVTAWRPEIFGDILHRDPRDYEARLRDLLRTAVSLATRSKDRVAVELSGGLDSSTVAATAGQLASQDPRLASRLCAYSFVASETKIADESEFQQELLRQYPLRHFTIDVDRFPHFGLYEGELPSRPSVNLLIPIVHSGLTRLASELDIGVCVTGEGGDALFFGNTPYPWFLCEHLRRLRIRKCCADFRAHLEVGSHSASSLLAIAAGRVGLPEGAEAPVWMTQRFSRVFERAIGSDLFVPLEFWRRPARALQLALIRRSALRPPKLDWDERHPFLYRPLVEYMLQIPWDQKIVPGRDRVLHRRAMVGILPERVRLRRDKGQALAAFLMGLRRNWNVVRPIGEGAQLAELGIVEPPAFKKCLDLLRHGYFSKRSTFTVHLAALSLEAWLSKGGFQQLATASRAHRARISRLRALQRDLPSAPQSYEPRLGHVSHV